MSCSPLARPAWLGSGSRSPATGESGGTSSDGLGIPGGLWREEGPGRIRTSPHFAGERRGNLLCWEQSPKIIICMHNIASLCMPKDPKGFEELVLPGPACCLLDRFCL